MSQSPPPVIRDLPKTSSNCPKFATHQILPNATRISIARTAKAIPLPCRISADNQIHLNSHPHIRITHLHRSHRLLLAWMADPSSSPDPCAEDEDDSPRPTRIVLYNRQLLQLLRNIRDARARVVTNVRCRELPHALPTGIEPNAITTGKADVSLVALSEIHSRLLSSLSSPSTRSNHQDLQLRIRRSTPAANSQQELIALSRYLSYLSNSYAPKPTRAPLKHPLTSLSTQLSRNLTSISHQIHPTNSTLPITSASSVLHTPSFSNSNTSVSHSVSKRDPQVLFEYNLHRTHQSAPQSAPKQLRTPRLLPNPITTHTNPPIVTHQKPSLPIYPTPPSPSLKKPPPAPSFQTRTYYRSMTREKEHHTAAALWQPDMSQRKRMHSDPHNLFHSSHAAYAVSSNSRGHSSYLNTQGVHSSPGITSVSLQFGFQKRTNYPFRKTYQTPSPLSSSSARLKAVKEAAVARLASQLENGYRIQPDQLLPFNVLHDVHALSDDSSEDEYIISANGKLVRFAGE